MLKPRAVPRYNALMEIELDCSGYWSAWQQWGLFSGVDGEDGVPESVDVCSLGIVEEKLPGLTELETLHIELIEQVRVVGYVEEGPQLGCGSLSGSAALGAVDTHEQ